MTRTTKEEINGSALYFLKKAHLIIAILIMLLTNAGLAFGAYYSLKADVNANFLRIDSHIQNPDIHMTYKSKVEEFVPRGEYDDLKDLIIELRTEVKELRKELSKGR